jgi:hypothetical protein
MGPSNNVCWLHGTYGILLQLQGQDKAAHGAAQQWLAVVSRAGLQQGRTPPVVLKTAAAATKRALAAALMYALP